MIAISAGTEATISDQITSLGTNLIFVSSAFTRMGPGVSNSTELVLNDATAIADQISRVTGVVVEQDASETVKAGSVSLSSISITGASPDFLTVRDLTVSSGRFFTAEDVTNKKKGGCTGIDAGNRVVRENGTDWPDPADQQHPGDCDRRIGCKRYGRRC